MANRMTRVSGIVQSGFALLGLSMVALVLSGCAQRRSGGLSNCCAATTNCSTNCSTEAAAVSPCSQVSCAPSPVACDPCAAAPQPCGDRPPNAAPGEAWCRVLIPAQYETKETRVCVSPAGKRKQWVPPVYDTRPKMVRVSGPEMTENTTPARFASKKVQIRVPGETRCACQTDNCGCPTYSTVTEPDTFRTECERVCLSPERQCFKYSPAKFRMTQERFLTKPGFCQEICTPAKYKTITNRICVTPGKWVWRRNQTCEVPEPVATVVKLPALQVEMADQCESGEERGIFSVGETVRYTLRVMHDDGSEAMPSLQVKFSLPPELKFISGGGDGVTVNGTSQEASSDMFALNIGEVKTLQVLAQVVGVSPTHMVQMIASVQSESGQELARETESTTVK